MFLRIADRREIKGRSAHVRRELKAMPHEHAGTRPTAKADVLPHTTGRLQRSGLHAGLADPLGTEASLTQELRRLNLQ
jgi:hypothetical protein